MAKPQLQNWTKEQLIDEVARLRKRKKYGLVWEDKPEDVVEQCKRELPVLKEVKNRAIAKDKNGLVNILIEGDNYHALSVLNYTHKGKIDVIYIDPPYNTGSKDFKYNDHYVDKEDSYRHSKWLSFMDSRLRFAKNILKRSGVLFISIDDNEYAALKVLCDELFGEKNVETMIWHKVTDDSGRLKITYRFRREHEYILVCYKNKDSVFFSKYLSDRNYKNVYTNPDNDPRGPYKQGIISNTEAKSNPKSKNYYSIKTPSGRIVKRQWRFPEEEFRRLDKDNRIYYGKDGASIPSIKVFTGEQKETTPISLLSGMGTAKTAGFELEAVLGSKPRLYPKPVALIQHLIRIASTENGLIFDFMAGSGTTGHAVLALNKEDEGNRRFILCTNNENNIATEVCYPRVAKVIEGYKDAKGKKVASLGGNLKYFRTAFVGAEPNDKNKEALTKQATEMLCMREDTFEPVKETRAVKIFKNYKTHTGIVFDEDAIPMLKKDIAKIGGVWSVYIFSLGDDTFEDEFEDMEQKITVAPIPEAILRVYRRLFKP
jgi:adenine-specific DNA-methyltransferase